MKKIYKKTGKDKYELIVENDPVEINLKALKAEVTLLQSQIGKEPTNQELIEHGRAFHPYFMQRPQTESRIAELNELIAILEAL
jgi:hypothetical protein